ncbi:DUF664 domain-containing protein [Nocardia lijiangensis]|uniref:mycothiol transferase n=1 Tax=Nocardia lijiangensis TaxID=299618 RepID=UPI003D71B62D
MMWTAPDVERTPSLLVADERPMLQAWLDRHRQTLLWKCAGLHGEQLRSRPLAPSGLSLLGLIRHMSERSERIMCQRASRMPEPSVSEAQA